MKKKCRILPAGGLGVVSHSLNKSPNLGGFRGLIKTISVICMRFRNKFGRTENVTFLVNLQDEHTNFTARMI